MSKRDVDVEVCLSLSDVDMPETSGCVALSITNGTSRLASLWTRCLFSCWLTSRCAEVNIRSCESALSVQIESFSLCSSIPVKVPERPSRLFAWLAFFILFSFLFSIHTGHFWEVWWNENRRGREERRVYVASAVQWWIKSSDVDMLKR